MPISFVAARPFVVNKWLKLSLSSPLPAEKSTTETRNAVTEANRGSSGLT